MKFKLMLLSTLVLFALSVVAKTTTDTKSTKGTITYEITKHTISSGGGRISGGIYTVETSIGQIDAGHNATGGIYEFSGGFLACSTTNNDIIFKDGFE